MAMHARPATCACHGADQSLSMGDDERPASGDGGPSVRSMALGGGHGMGRSVGQSSTPQQQRQRQQRSHSITAARRRSVAH